MFACVRGLWVKPCLLELSCRYLRELSCAYLCPQGQFEGEELLASFRFMFFISQIIQTTDTKVTAPSVLYLTGAFRESTSLLLCIEQ